MSYLKKYGVTIAVVILFFILSYASGYNIISPYEVNLDLAMMLTPYGILKNYILSETILTPYYANVPSKGGMLYDLELASIVLILEVLLFYLFIRWRHKKDD